MFNYQRVSIKSPLVIEFPIEQHIPYNNMISFHPYYSIWSFFSRRKTKGFVRCSYPASRRRKFICVQSIFLLFIQVRPFCWENSAGSFTHMIYLHVYIYIYHDIYIYYIYYIFIYHIYIYIMYMVVIADCRAKRETLPPLGHHHAVTMRAAGGISSVEVK